MKRFSIFTAILASMVLSGCKYSGNGNLIGVQGREEWYQPIPFGMLFIPPGSYVMGPSDQDVPYALTAQSKTVTVQAFYMDETEITNNEYRQFVFWVRDSLAHILLGELNPEEHLIEEDQYGEPIDPPYINWSTKINWNGEEEREALSAMYLPEHERYYRRKEFDTRKFNYEFYRIDYQSAAKKQFKGDNFNPDNGALANRPQGLKDRSVYVIKETINIYPDTLSWIHDYTYSFNEPMTQNYFWHPAYDNYPVVGISWRQARAFCVWRTQLMNNYLKRKGETIVNDFRLPTESEWEWAARGGLDLSPYP